MQAKRQPSVDLELHTAASVVASDDSEYTHTHRRVRICLPFVHGWRFFGLRARRRYHENVFNVNRMCRHFGCFFFFCWWVVCMYVMWVSECVFVRLYKLQPCGSVYAACMYACIWASCCQCQCVCIYPYQWKLFTLTTKCMASVFGHRSARAHA